jgi:hypothetical protein
VPLALLLGLVTEDLSLRLGQTAGGLLNATFGNARAPAAAAATLGGRRRAGHVVPCPASGAAAHVHAAPLLRFRFPFETRAPYPPSSLAPQVVEVVLALAALRRDLFAVVAASLLGSVLSNMLLVLGSSFFAAGLRRARRAGGRVLQPPGPPRPGASPRLARPRSPLVLAQAVAARRASVAAEPALLPPPAKALRLSPQLTHPLTPHPLPSTRLPHPPNPLGTASCA